MTRSLVLDIETTTDHNIIWLCCCEDLDKDRYARFLGAIPLGPRDAGGVAQRAEAVHIRLRVPQRRPAGTMPCYKCGCCLIHRLWEIRGKYDPEVANLAP